MSPAREGPRAAARALVVRLAAAPPVVPPVVRPSHARDALVRPFLRPRLGSNARRTRTLALDRHGRCLGRNPPERPRRHRLRSRRREQPAEPVGVDLGRWAATHTRDGKKADDPAARAGADLWTA
jgi:hypothetical protein